MEGQKQKAINDILFREEAGAILITSPEHLRFLSGFRGGEGILYLSEMNRILITDSRYTEAAGKETDFTVLEESVRHRRTDILLECMKREDVSVVCYEDEDLRCRAFSELKKALDTVKEWKPLGRQIRDMRMIKTEAELVLLEEAESIGDRAFSDILRILRAGMTEKQIAAELEYSMKKHGAEGFSFPTIVASGKHSSMPHAVPTDKPVEEGDFVTMDFGCVFGGYCSDMTRTVVVGRADERMREIYETVLRAQQNCLDHLRAGMSGREADGYARKVIEDAGYGAYFGHGTGHSVGLCIHEEPRLSPSDGTILAENMIETVEPGIYIPGFGGVRIEDMVIVKENGHINLTRSPKELIEL